MDATTKKVPSVGYAALMMISFAAFLIIGLLVFGAPLQTVVFLAWLLMNALSLPLGYTYRDLEKIGLDAVRGSLPPVVITPELEHRKSGYVERKRRPYQGNVVRIA